MFILLFSFVFSSLSAQKFSYEKWKNFITKDTASTRELKDFIRVYPDIPLLDQFKIKIEKKLQSESEIENWFSKNTPVSLLGYIKWISHLLKTKQTIKANQVITSFWREKIEITPQEQKEFYNRFGVHLTSKDYYYRFKLLNYSQNDLAKPLIFLRHQCLDPRNLKDLNTFLEIYRANKRKDHEFCLEKISKSYGEEQFFPDPWGKLRIFYTRYLLERKRYQEALQVISKHCMKKGELYCDAQWLKGWLLFHFLKQDKRAFLIFQKSYDEFTMPISKARFAFWTAQVLQRLNPSLTKEWYNKACKFPGTFYGQLACQKLGLKKVCLSASSEEKMNFWTRVFSSIPLSDPKEFVFSFLSKAAKEVKTIEEGNTLISIAERRGPDWAVWAAKKVGTFYTPLIFKAYPKLSTETFEKAIKKLDIQHFWPLVHSIIRQESRFDSKAQSSANAQGLMQVLPSVARKESQDLDQRFNWIVSPDLFRPFNNVVLGAYHLKKLLECFKGDYVLSICAYNAGKEAVEEWIKDFGCPGQKLDTINWIEHIPYSETRNYVQRVMENLYVYIHFR